MSRAATYAVDGDVAGELSHYTAKAEDNLYAVARRFDLGIVELLAANPGVDPWMPKPGSTLVIPTMHVLPSVREGIVINLSELRLYYFPNAKEVVTFPIGIGMEGRETPLGITHIVKKRYHPEWIPPASIRKANPGLPGIVPAGPDNPMGEYALNLGWDRYAIHGTNRPGGIGRRASHGCIRLYPEDIKALFGMVKEGMKVTVVDEAYSYGWQGDKLWLQVVPTQEQADIIAEDYKEPAALDIPDIYKTLDEAAGNADLVNWYRVDEAVAQRTGIPAVIAERKERQNGLSK